MLLSLVGILAFIIALIILKHLFTVKGYAQQFLMIIAIFITMLMKWKVSTSALVVALGVSSSIIRGLK